MITTVAADDGIGVRVDLPSGSVAYFDADWIAPEPGRAVPAIVVDAGTKPDAVAGRALVDVAREAVAAAESRSPVEVWGSGAVAITAARLLGVAALVPNGDSSARPQAIVEATGDPSAIVEATRRLDDLGTLVLAGEPLGRTVQLNLYPDVHSRGLVVVGIHPPLVGVGKACSSPGPELPPPALVEPGSLLPKDALWYRVA